MKKRNYFEAIFALIVLLVMLTLLDICVIKYFWLPNRTTSFGSHLPWFWWLPFWTMQLIFPLSVSFLLENKIPLISYILFLTGLEDTLFYIIAWQKIPEIYKGIYYLGVFYSPTREVVLVGNLIGITMSIIICANVLRRQCQIAHG
jgi:hypothetical protein